MTGRPIHLKSREVLDIHDGEGLAVKCLRGVLWITQSGDTDDIIVRGGETFVLDRDGLALISAPTGPADLVIQHGLDRAHVIGHGHALPRLRAA
jgi:Protein of unknown function (DUF2917)